MSRNVESLARVPGRVGADFTAARRRGPGSPGHFDREIVPALLPAHTSQGSRGQPDVEVPKQVVTRDDGPRPGTTLEGFSALKPAFREGGTVTAGNACPLNDGAAALLIMSDERARNGEFKPRARIIASTVAAIEPEVMGIGPIPAIGALLEQTGMQMSDIDVVEINEAFAAQIVPLQGRARDLRREAQPVRRRNRTGSPVRDDRRPDHDDAAEDLETLDGTYGIESMCVAGGMGMAMLVERLG